MGSSSFKNLNAWTKAIDLSVEIYQQTKKYPSEERYRLVDQLCRAAVSVPANIAEADGRFSRLDQIRFLHIARGSLYEAQTLVIISSRLGFMELGAARRFEEKYDEVARLINGLIRQKRNAG